MGGNLSIQEGENIRILLQWGELPNFVIDGADGVKAVESQEDSQAVEVQPGKTFHLGKSLAEAENAEYMADPIRDLWTRGPPKRGNGNQNSKGDGFQ